jgi:hypothetical protein
MTPSLLVILPGYNTKQSAMRGRFLHQKSWKLLLRYSLGFGYFVISAAPCHFSRLNTEREVIDESADFDLISQAKNGNRDALEKH